LPDPSSAQELPKKATDQNQATAQPPAWPSAAEVALIIGCMVFNGVLLLSLYHQPHQPFIALLFCWQTLAGGAAIAVFPFALNRFRSGLFFPGTGPEGLWLVAAVSYTAGVMYDLVQMQFGLGFIITGIGTFAWAASFLLAMAMAIGSRWQHALVTLFVLAGASVFVTVLGGNTLAEFSKLVAVLGMFVVISLRLIHTTPEPWTTWVGCLTFFMIHCLSTLSLVTLVPRLWLH
jgi:hypothetical protein